MGPIYVSLVVSAVDSCHRFAGSPYLSVAFYHLLGTSTGVAVEADGTSRTSTSGPGALLPDWLTKPSGALTVNSTRWLPHKDALDSGVFSMLSHADARDVREYFTQSLREQGFEVEDVGLGTLDQRTAAFVGIAGTLLAERASTGHELSIQIQTPQSLILKPRLVTIVWRKLGPGQTSGNAKYRSHLRAQNNTSGSSD